MRKTFVLSFGAQKAGTTWLYSQLSQSQLVDFGWMKEYHFLDSHTVESCRPFFLQRYQQLRKIIGQSNVNKGKKVLEKHHHLIQSLSFHANPSLYFDYFASILRGEVTVSGDLTPSNALISEETIQWVNSEFFARNVRCAGLLVMRDPVERFWSAIRMIRRKHPDRWSNLSEDEHILMALERDDFLQRGAYQDIISRMKRSFAPDDMNIQLYEELTRNEANFSQLCEFIGIDYFQPSIDRRENESPKSSEIHEGTVRSIALRSMPSYNAAIDLFGEKRIRNVWPSLEIFN